MAPPLRSPPAGLRPPMLFVVSVALAACAGTKPAAPRHAAHGHAIATIERPDGNSQMIDLAFEVAPTGDVRGVDVEPTPGLDHAGIRECARRAIWDTQFPAFDGADMVVSYRLDID